MLIHTPTPDPYLGLFRLMGGKPQVLCHGDDLPSGTVATWDARHGALDGTVAGTVSRNDTGWVGGGSLTLPTLEITGNGQWVAFDAEASNYGASTPLLWVGASRFTASAALRYACFLGSSSLANNWRGFNFNATTDITLWNSNRNGSSESDSSSTAVLEGVQSVWAVLLKGGTVHMVQRTSGGNTTLINNQTHSMAGTLNVNKFTFGALVLSGSQVGNGGFGHHRFFSALRDPGADQADLPNILSYVQHNLRCPLP